jgi:hypothetical protein
MVIHLQLRMRHIVVICGLPHSTVRFPHYLLSGTMLKKKDEHKLCVVIFLYNI